MAARIGPGMQGLVRQLERRYPGVRVVRASLLPDGHGRSRQCLRLQAPLAVLLAKGLVTAEMVRAYSGGVPGRSGAAAWPVTEHGDPFVLFPPLGPEEGEAWDLLIYTDAVPRDAIAGGTTAARQLLARLAGKAAGAARPDSTP